MPCAYSDIVSAIPSAELPLAPEIKEQELVAGSTWASLSWTESVGAQKYIVYQATNIGGPYNFRAILDNSTYEDLDLENGVTYYYVIAAINENGCSAFSSEAIIAASALAEPHAPILTGWPQNEGVVLHRDSASGAVSYTLKRSQSFGGNFVNIGNFTSTTYYDTDLTNGTTYYYVVDAHNASSTIASSNVIAVNPSESLPIPDNISVIPGNTQATLIWSPVDGASNYYVQIAESPGGTAIQSQVNVKPSYTATGLTNGQDLLL